MNCQSARIFRDALAASTLVLSLGTAVSADPIVFNSDNGEVTVAGSIVTDLRGTGFTTTLEGNVRRWFFAGDLNLLADDDLSGIGGNGISLVVGNNVHIAPGATLDFSAVARTAAPGGGIGGAGGSSSNGGGGGEGGSEGIPSFERAAGGAGGSNRLFATFGGNGGRGATGGDGGLGAAGGLGGLGQRGGEGGSGINNAVAAPVGGAGHSVGGIGGGPSTRGFLGLDGKGGLGGVGGLGSLIPATGGLGGTGGFAGGSGGSGGNAISAGGPGSGGGGGMNKGVGEIISGGQGGRGGGQGSGGGGAGGGGGGGAGGAGGGGGGGGGIIPIFGIGGGYGGDGGSGGLGGDGGHGADGGDGGRGGSGGHAGGGGGAFEIIAFGRIEAGGAFSARGGNGGNGGGGANGAESVAAEICLPFVGCQPETFRGAGEDGESGAKAPSSALGWGGPGGKWGILFGLPGVLGAPGERGGGGAGGGGSGPGGVGSLGGSGKDGGAGAGGGGGAGGTIKLQGSIVDAGGTSVNTSGGISGIGAPGAGNGLAGGPGRFLLGSNTVATPPGSILNAQQSVFDGTRGVNPFIKGASTQTPYLPDLVGGAELFGVLDGLDANAADFSELRGSAPAGAVAAIMRFDLGPAGHGDDFSGFDLLALLNLTDHALTDPMLGVDPTDTDASFRVPLLQGGFETNPLFGGAGLAILTELTALGVYGTLVPDSGTLFNVSLGGAEPLSISLANGEFAHIVPIPAALPLMLSGMLGLSLIRRRRH